MKPCYWELNPEELLRENPYYYQENKSEDLKDLSELIIFYKKYSDLCENIQKNISFCNFKESIISILEYEAILSEISYYLRNIDFETIENKKLISLIKEEYLVDYYHKLENNEEEYFLTSLLYDKVLYQRKKNLANFFVLIIFKKSKR